MPTYKWNLEKSFLNFAGSGNASIIVNKIFFLPISSKYVRWYVQMLEILNNTVLCNRSRLVLCLFYVYGSVHR